MIAIGLIELLKRNEYGVAKFVRVGAEYRFCGIYGDHSKLVNDGEFAASAGFVRYDLSGNIVAVMNQESMSLNLGPLPDDEPAIQELFSKCLRDMK